MASNIKFKRSAVQNRVPTTAQLDLGELALNTYDGKLYTEINTGSAAVIEIGSKLSSLVVDGDNGAGGGDVTFHGTTANRDLVWDHSADRLILKDNTRIQLGDAATDLEMYHSGNNASITNNTGNFFLTNVAGSFFYLRTNNLMITRSDQSKTLGNFTTSGVYLYHDNSIRVTTTADGADISGTGSLKIPVGTTAQRSGSPVAGDLRYNTTTGGFEGYSSSWGELGGGGIGIGSTSTNPSSGVVANRIGVGFTDINVVGTGISVTGYGTTIVLDFNDFRPGSFNRSVHNYTATAGQTTFAGLNYNNSTKQIAVYLNGARLSADTYTATSGTTVVLDVGASVGDEVEIINIHVNSDVDRKVNNYTATAGQTTFTGLSYNSSTELDVYLNGIRLASADYTATSGNTVVLAVGASVNDIVDIVSTGDGVSFRSTADASGDRFTLTNVGIGTDQTPDKLNVRGNSSFVGVTTIAHTGANQLVIKDSDTSGTNAQMKISFRDSGNTEQFFIGNDTTNSYLYLGSPSGQNNNIGFRVSGNDRLTISSSSVESNVNLIIPHSILHQGDSDTKISFPSDDTFTVTTGGSTRLSVTNTGASVTGNLNVSGVLTYDDVTNVDSVGIITARAGIVVSGGTVTIPTVAGTNTNTYLNVLFQTAAGVIDGGSALTYNPSQDVLSVNGNFINANTFRGDGNLGTLTCANHSSTTAVAVSNTIDITTVDNAADAFTLKQGSNEYITVDTTNSSELITLGNTTTNPNISILGSITVSESSPAATGANFFFTDDGSATTLGTAATLRVANNGGNAAYSVFEAESGSGSIRLANNGLFYVTGDTKFSNRVRTDISSTVDGFMGEAYSNYFGLKHTDQTLGSEYMIISRDDSTFISASSGNPVRIRYGGNDSTNELLVGSGNDALTWRGNGIFHAGNDGSGSGLDADTLDGVQGSSFLRSDASDTASGAIAFTSGQLHLSSHYFQSFYSGTTNYIHLYPNGHSGNASVTNIRAFNGTGADVFQIVGGSATGLSWRGYTIWTAENDGSGSTLDADTLDGVQGSSFLRSDANDTYSANLTFSQDGQNGFLTTAGGTTFHNVGGSSSKKLVLRNLAELRFQDAADWNYNEWAGIKFVTSTDTMYIGGAASNNFTNNGGAANIDVNFVGLNGNGLKKDGNTVWHAGNDGSGSGLDADLLDGSEKSAFVLNNQNSGYVLRFGSGSNTGNTSSSYAYAIFQEGGAWSSPFPDLRINYHTGIVLAAHQSYGGIRFQRDYNDTTELMSIGDGDSNVNISNQLLVNGTGRNRFDGVSTIGASGFGFTLGANGTYHSHSVGHNATQHAGIFWHSGANYGIYREAGNWSGNYTQLRIDWPTGIKIDGGDQYGMSGVHFDSHLYPFTNNTKDLGSTSLRWRNIYSQDLNVIKASGNLSGTFVASNGLGTLEIGGSTGAFIDLKMPSSDDFDLRIGTSGSGGYINGNLSITGTVTPGANNTYDLGSTSIRWRNIFTNDLNLSNEGSANDVDGTWGNFTIQEGEDDLFLINKRSGKKYKFNLTEVS